MAKKFNKGGKRPNYSLSFSARIKKGKYKQGPYVGLWDADGKVMARGSVKENYLSDLVEFLTQSAKKDYAVGVSLFKNSKKRDDDGDDDDDDEEEEDEDEEEEEDEDEEDEEDEKPAKGKGKKKGKKGGWDFDDDED